MTLAVDLLTEAVNIEQAAEDLLRIAARLRTLAAHVTAGPARQMLAARIPTGAPVGEVARIIADEFTAADRETWAASLAGDESPTVAEADSAARRRDADRWPTCNG